jgi:5-methylcytosine-specific restriction endonuclease McrA
MDSLKAACYRLIQQVVLTQYPFCRRCQKPPEVGHHIFKRDRLGTAFNPLAVVALCNACHTFVHSKPREAKTLAKEWLGDDYEKLEALSRMVVQFRAEDYRELKKTLTTLLDEPPF